MSILSPLEENPLPRAPCGLGQRAAYQVGRHISAIRGAGMNIALGIDVFDYFHRGVGYRLFVNCTVKQCLFCVAGANRCLPHAEQSNVCRGTSAGTVKTDDRGDADQSEVTMSSGDLC